jgi:hypothetical protein
MNRFRFTPLAVAFALTLLTAAGASAQPTDRTALAKEIESLREQLRQKEQELLAPSAEDRAAFADFLRQPDTGLIRLLPREKYQDKLTMNGGGAYYSFTRLTNEYGFGSDIGLEQGQLGVGFAGADFGFLSKLGDVPLAAVTFDHPGVRLLAEFTSPTKEAEAREQYRRGYPGFNANGFDYTHRLRARVDTTYVLRSINYDRSDVLVAFRVVREDADGSLILLWKLLKKFPAPELNRISAGN